MLLIQACLLELKIKVQNSKLEQELLVDMKIMTTSMYTELIFPQKQNFQTSLIYSLLVDMINIHKLENLHFHQEQRLFITQAIDTK